MTTTLQGCTRGLLGELMAVAAARTPPEAARDRLREALDGAPAALTLLWEQQPADGSYSYTAVVRSDDEGTMSLTYAPPGGVPWALRGARRWSERDLVRVNETVLRVEDLIASLDARLRDASFLEHLVDTCLIREELEARPIEPSDEELQDALDRFRIARGLHDVATTRAWLARRGDDDAALEDIAREEATQRGLRARVAGDRVPAQFAAQREQLARVTVTTVELEDETAAAQLVAAASAPRRDLVSEAAALAGRVRFRPAPLIETLRAGSLGGELGIGAVLGPIRVAGGFRIHQVVAIDEAVLDDDTAAELEQQLFRAWLAERRDAAAVEWYWGSSR